MIYHYTSVDAFQSIMKSYRSSEDKENLVFWASNILSMNDPTEMQMGFNAIMKYLPRIEDELKVVQTKRLSRLTKDYQISELTEQDSEQIFREKSFNPMFAPYVLSFSKEKESIPMWYMYGKGGHGINLYFDEKEINNTKDLLLVDINYHEDIVGSSYISTIKNVITKQYKNYLEKVDGINSSYSILLEKIITIRRICSMLSPFFKNRLFDYENECRVIVYFPTRKINYRYSSKGFLVPYIEQPIPIKSLRAIGLGPCSNLYGLRQKIRMELDLSILNNEIEIYDSNVPLRDI